MAFPDLAVGNADAGAGGVEVEAQVGAENLDRQGVHGRAGRRQLDNRRCVRGIWSRLGVSIQVESQ